jgi:hypothetical protein
MRVSFSLHKFEVQKDNKFESQRIVASITIKNAYLIYLNERTINNIFEMCKK